MPQIAWLDAARAGTTVARQERMGIDIALVTVTLVTLAFATSRVMRRERPVAVAEEAPKIPQRRAPAHFALPPVTIETLPMKLEYVPDMVPPIDRSVLALLVASGSPAAAMVSRPESLARGSVPPGPSAASSHVAERPTSHSDLDGAETLRQAGDLDEDALTRTNMSPVA